MCNRLLAALSCGLALAAANARADDVVNVPCSPLSDVKDAAKYRAATHDEWMALRVAFYMAPDTPASFPPGDRALIGDNDDGSETVLFVDGGDACAPMRLGEQGVAMLLSIRERKISHATGRM